MASTDHVEGVNLVLTFEDQDGREWLAAAFMAPLQRVRSDEFCDVSDMPDRVFRLKKFHVVDAGRVPQQAGGDSRGA